jgi:hypothetical protein
MHIWLVFMLCLLPTDLLCNCRVPDVVNSQELQRPSRTMTTTTDLVQLSEVQSEGQTPQVFGVCIWYCKTKSKVEKLYSHQQITIHHSYSVRL